MFMPIIVPQIQHTFNKVEDSVETLPQYTNLTKEQFYAQFKSHINNKCGIITTIKLYEALHNFDNISLKEKQQLVRFVEGIEEPSIIDNVIAFFKNKFGKSK